MALALVCNQPYTIEQAIWMQARRFPWDGVFPLPLCQGCWLAFGRALPFARQYFGKTRGDFGLGMHLYCNLGGICGLHEG